MPIVVDLDVMLAQRKLGVGEFAAAVGITPANVAVLKNGRARAIRFSTLEAICRVLECQPGDVLRWVDDDAGEGGRAGDGHEDGPRDVLRWVGGGAAEGGIEGA